MKNVFVFIFSFLFFPASTFAQAFPRAYYRNPEVQNFQESGTLEKFLEIPEEWRVDALTEIVLNRSMRQNSTEIKPTPYQDEDRIWKTYYVESSPQNQVAILRKAFLIAVDQSENAAVANFFKEISAVSQLENSKAKKAELICASLESIWSDGPGYIAFDEDRFKNRVSVVKNLVSLVAQAELGSQSCAVQFESEGSAKKISIESLMVQAGEEIQDEFRAQYLLFRAAQLRGFAQRGSDFQKSIVACTARLLTGHFDDAVQKLTQKPRGGHYLHYVNDANCSVNGIVSDLGPKKGFFFHLNYGRPGVEKMKLPFKTSQEIVKALLN